MVETDAPYLTPVPFRGKRNDSGYVHLVAEKIAQLKENPALATVPAIQNDRIISVKLCEVFASSMTGSTVEKFAQAFHPDCFA